MSQSVLGNGKLIAGNITNNKNWKSGNTEREDQTENGSFTVRHTYVS